MQNHADNIYLNLLEHILKNGQTKTDRTGTGTKSIFGYQMRFNLADGFPLLTTKKLPIKSIIHELLWFIKGDTNLKYLADNNVHIWDEWPYKAYLKRNNLPIPETISEEWKNGMKEFVEKIKADENFAKVYGDLGPVYGYQWRKWKAPDGRIIDQLGNAIELIKKYPDSRRIIVSAWNPADIDEMAKAGLPPCHCLFQFWVSNSSPPARGGVAEGRGGGSPARGGVAEGRGGGSPARGGEVRRTEGVGAPRKLSCQLYQRSCDTFLGVPFNIASYSLLTMIISQICGLEVGEFIWTGGDTHLYLNHLDQVNLQLSRKNDIRPMPKMKINPSKMKLEDFTIDDFELLNYNSHDAIKAPIAV